jgi:superfamily II DNA or RNA helicase
VDKKMMKLTISNKLNITDFSFHMVEIIQERLTFANPKYLENEKMGRWNGETPEYLKFYDYADNGGIIIPRGFARQLVALCQHNNAEFKFDDKRRTLPVVDFAFFGQLRPFQVEAANAMLAKDFGTLSAPTGSGKTVMALYIIAARRQPALIVVHTKELLNQWISRIETFLGIPADGIGIIGAGKKTIGSWITVALVQSLYKCAHEVSQHIGHLIVDECHRAPSRTFTEAVTAFDSKYILGLSATPWRRDKLSKLIFWHIGDVQHEIDRANLEDTGDILRAQLVTRETDFRPWHDPSAEYSKMLSELTADLPRNQLIAADVAAEASNGGGICLVLSDRKTHCESLREILEHEYGIDAVVLTGDLSAHGRQDIVDRLNDGKIKVLVATGQLIGEGFDCRGLSTLFLATPIRFSGRVIQYLGRVLRPAPGKTVARVFDYVDIEVPQLVASAKARQRVYG